MAAKKEGTKSSAHSKKLFTVNSSSKDSFEVPTITHLLNRKKLRKPYGLSVESPGKSASGKTQERTAPKPRVQKIVKRKISSSHRRLTLWTQPELEQGQDEISRGLNLLLMKGGVQQALLLRLVEGSMYRASHGLEAGDKSPLWTGLRFHPSTAPEIWKILARDGFMEIPGGAEQSYAKVTSGELEAAAFARTLFGLLPEEWLLLFRCGTISRCYGILAVVADRGMAGSVAEAVKIFSLDTGQFNPKKSKSAA